MKNRLKFGVFPRLCLRSVFGVCLPWPQPRASCGNVGTCAHAARTWRC